MQFKGRKFNKCKTVVVLPGSEWKGGSQDGKIPNNYMTFGRLIPPWKNVPENAVPYVIEDETNAGLGLWAVPIKCDGHSLTNMMYAENNTRFYLYQNGRVWTCKFRDKPITKEKK